MEPNDNGTIYLGNFLVALCGNFFAYFEGDGCMGVDVIPVDSEPAWYLAKVAEKAHFFFGSISDNFVEVSSYDVSNTSFDSVNTTKK
jgi:hypothetical protein